MEAPPGILLISGPAVKPGKIAAGVYDIAPTVLYLFGLPLDKNMDGRPLQEIFRLSRKLKYAVYSLKQTGKGKRNQDADRETIEELKSLGYIN
jgi:arylsulfatase A-like enzyme